MPAQQMPAGDPPLHHTWGTTGINNSGLNDIIWTTDGAGIGGGWQPVTIPQQPLIQPSYPQPFLPPPQYIPQFHVSKMPVSFDKERTAKLERILGKGTVYIRKALKQDSATMSIDIEINNIEPPQTSAAGTWEGAVVLFNSLVSGAIAMSPANMSQHEIDDLVMSFAIMLTITGTRVIIDGKEIDP